ncbi:MAG: M48 family metallopeptidase [Candidatus Paceibacterota bacterium]
MRRFFIKRSILRGFSRRNYLKHKELARALVLARVEYFNQIYKLPVGRISIRNQRSRWGSCSKKGNLNFNYKVALIPAHLADYIIVHELCHLKEFNHSKRFWALVGQSTPNYLELRRELRGFTIPIR